MFGAGQVLPTFSLGWRGIFRLGPVEGPGLHHTVEPFLFVTPP